VAKGEAKVVALGSNTFVACVVLPAVWIRFVLAWWCLVLFGLDFVRFGFVLLSVSDFFGRF
jgi:hypothetical protein